MITSEPAYLKRFPLVEEVEILIQKLMDKEDLNEL